MASEYDLAVFAEHFQFYVQDKDTDNSLTIYWDELSREDLFCVGDEIVGVATVRSMEVPVSLALIDKKPKDESFDEWDHVVESSIQIKSGKLLVTGPTSDEMDSLTVEITPGFYGLRAYYGMLDEVDTEGFEGEDFYKVVLWPEKEPLETVVLKRWQPATLTVPDDEDA